jgi:hypothetical protein
MGDHPVPRSLPMHKTTQNIHYIYASNWIRTHDPVFERAKTVHALDRAATMIGAMHAIHRELLTPSIGKLENIVVTTIIL